MYLLQIQILTRRSESESLQSGPEIWSFNISLSYEEEQQGLGAVCPSSSFTLRHVFQKVETLYPPPAIPSSVEKPIGQDTSQVI